MAKVVSIATGEDVCNEICALIGVDPAHVKEINIRIAPGNMVVMEVETIVPGDGQPIAAMLRRWFLQEM